MEDTIKHELEYTKQELELSNMKLKARDEEIQQMSKTIEILKWRVEVQELLVSHVKEIADRLLQKIEHSQSPLIGKKDIMDIFNKESDFALRFLRSAKSMGYGLQIGKEYYIKREELEKILRDYQGLRIEM